MELNTEKIKKEFDRLGWTYEKAAEKTGLNSRQAVHYYMDSKSIRGAEIFAKALDIDPKDLLKS